MTAAVAIAAENTRATAARALGDDRWIVVQDERGLIAAAAERAGHTVLHLDKDFEAIAGVTGQPTERLRA